MIGGRFKIRRAYRAHEHAEQAALVLRVRTSLPGLAPFLWAIPNGGARHAKTGADLKLEGVRAGYPDLLVDLPRGPFHGLRLELKRTGARPSAVSAAQRAAGEALLSVGFLAVVGFGQDDAYEQLRRYWELGPFATRLPTDRDYEYFTLLCEDSLRVPRRERA